MSSTSTAIPAARIRAGTREFRQTNRAMFLGGFSTFALLYTVQPLLPLFAQEFGLSPMRSSWALSAATGALAVCLLLASVASDRVGRKGMMCLALLLSAVLDVACALVHSFTQLLVLRTLLGVTLAGLPAVALAYLGEEIDPPSLGYSVGLYIAGTALGGMTGRVATSFLTDYLTWRVALAVIGGAALLATAEFWRILPPSNHFKPGSLNVRAILTGTRRHFSDGGLPWFFCLAFLLMGAFVSVYNYLGFRLAGPEFGLRHSEVSLIFSLYLMGMFSSVWMGRLADRYGRRRVLWTVIATMLTGLLMTLSGSLLLIIAGIALFTFGFFGGHSIASSWVGRRAKVQAALASSLYLFFYYLGSSLIGSFSGLMWQAGGWSGVVAVLAMCLTLSLLVALRLRKLAPLAVPA